MASSREAAVSRRTVILANHLAPSLMDVEGQLALAASHAFSTWPLSAKKVRT